MRLRSTTTTAPTTTTTLALPFLVLAAAAALGATTAARAAEAAFFLSPSPAARRWGGREVASGRAEPRAPSSSSRRCRSTKTRLPLSNDDEAAGGAPAVGGELVSALAKLDRKWELARREAGGGENKIGEWTVLDVSGTTDDDDGESSNKQPPEIVYLLEPPSGSVPSCVILFLGGAVLGQFPHVAYGAFLKRLASKVNGSVIAVPYEVGLDHFELSKIASERFRKAIVECEDRRGYPETTPKYAIGHSLGSKLHAISIAATGIGEDLAGMGFISYNNFSFGQTLGMAKTFAKDMGVGNGGGFGGASFGAAGGAQLDFDAIFDLAEQAVDFVGLQFSPSPEDMDRIVSTKFDDDVVSKTRLFVFDDDDLDSSRGFLESCERGGESDGAPSVSYLPGTHLTPVYLKLGLDDLPDEARDVGRQVSGGFENASFGDEGNLDMLVEEASDWMLGKSPSGGDRRRKMIAGAVDAKVEE